MYYYNWFISGDMFLSLIAILRPTMNSIVKVQSNCLSNWIPLFTLLSLYLYLFSIQSIKRQYPKECTQRIPLAP